jgi:hypothetical protein
MAAAEKSLACVGQPSWPRAIDFEAAAGIEPAYAALQAAT